VTATDVGFGTREAAAAADFIRSKLHGESPRIAIVLGSGLGGLADRISSSEVVRFREIPGFPESTVVGHAGALISGRLGAKPVVALSGRFHVYEGHGARLVEATARSFGWDIASAMPAEGRLEATDTTRWFGFKDDVVVRVVSIPEGSRVDVRSVSRIGRSDLGANARRIRGFLAALSVRARA